MEDPEVDEVRIIWSGHGQCPHGMHGGCQVMPLMVVVVVVLVMSGGGCHVMPIVRHVMPIGGGGEVFEEAGQGRVAPRGVGFSGNTKETTLWVWA